MLPIPKQSRYPFSFNLLPLTFNLFRSALLLRLLPLALILCLLSVTFSLTPITGECWAATYYVDSTNGNDSNPGTSYSSPWKTIAKVNASTFVPGDSVLFKRGEVWRERLRVPSSGSSVNPITFGAYGTGNKPLISGADIIKFYPVQ